METLFVVAEMQEAKYLIDYYKMRRRTVYSVNLWANDDFQLIITGAGIDNVIESLSNAVYIGILNPLTNIINVGYAGSVGMNVGEVVCVRDCFSLNFPTIANVERKNCTSLSNEGYDCYTSFDFVTNAGNVKGKALFDMELAYIARFMYKSLYSIKIVSDNLDYDGFKEFDGDKAWKKAIKMIEERVKTNVSRNIAP